MSETSLTTQIQCLNCGEALAGSFCQGCGQEDKEVKRPFLYFLQEFLRVVFELDGRAYRTVYYLFTRPGFLAKEYFAGRRVSYTPPLRLFLIISIGFFLIIGSVATISSIQEGLSGTGSEEIATEESDASSTGDENEPIEVSFGDTEFEIDRESGEGFTEENKQNIRDQFALLSLPFLTPETNQKPWPLYGGTSDRKHRRSKRKPKGILNGFSGVLNLFCLTNDASTGANPKNSVFLHQEILRRASNPHDAQSRVSVCCSFSNDDCRRGGRY